MTTKASGLLALLSICAAATIAPRVSRADELGMAAQLADFRVEHRSDRYETEAERMRVEREFMTALAHEDFVQRSLAGVTGPSNAYGIYYQVAYLFHNNQTTYTTKTLGNPYGAEYGVPFGRFRGENVVGTRTERQSYEGGYQEQRYTTAGRHGLRSNGGGWSFEPERAGVLEARWDLEHYDVRHIPFNGTTGGYYSEECSVALRYTFTGRDGVYDFLPIPEPQRADSPLERSCNYFHTTDTKIPDDSYLKAQDCRDQAAMQCGQKPYAPPTRFWSTNGQVLLDTSDPARPRMTYPDGSVTELAEDAGAHLPFNAGLMDQASGFDSRPQKLYGVRRVVDAAGNQTLYTRNAVTDPRGRTTYYDRGADGRVTRIRAPGPGGRELVYEMTWTELTWSLDAFGAPGAFADEYLTRPREGGGRTGRYTTLTELRIPGGRSYKFFYGIDPSSRSHSDPQGFGHLSRVETPDGAVTTWKYGSTGTPSHRPIMVGDEPHEPWMLEARPIERRDYPNGDAGGATALVTRFVHETDATITVGPGRPCAEILWSKTIHPDGTATRIATCHNVSGSPMIGALAVEGRPLAELELDAAGNVVEATYRGQTGEVADGSPVGTLFLASESLDGRALDLRPTKIVHVRDGLTWTEAFDYGRIEQLAYVRGSGNAMVRAQRTDGNVVSRKVIPGVAGAPILVEATDYVADPAYRQRNLLRLVRSSKTLVPSDAPGPTVGVAGALKVLSRIDYGYDEDDDKVAVVSTGAKGRDPGVTPLGLATTKRTWLSPDASIATRTRYYDTGEVHEQIDARGHALTFVRDHAQCTPNSVLAVTTKTAAPDPVSNPARHVTVTYRDCATDLELAVRDVNENLTCRQYDGIGRIIETAVPGDALSLVEGALRFADCPTIGTGLGAGGQGPSTWIEYVDEGLPGRSRIVTHARNGSSAGLSKTQVKDGLGRVVQECDDVDPRTVRAAECNGECTQICTVSTFDHQGRTASVSVPFATTARAAAGPVPDGVRTRRTDFDVLGRATRTELLGSGLPATLTTYGSEGGRFVVETSTSGAEREKRTRTYSDLLGHVTEVAESAPGVPGCDGLCRTAFTTDAVGRVVRIMGPGGPRESVTFTYDGAGRRIGMTDPDLGTWHYAVDENGNRTSRTDAKGQTIRYEYDALDRLVKKTLPSGPEDERVTLFCYDGAVPNGDRCAK
ncbi:MAG: RHS repeat protein [Deltaproteobacteria bacterium]|nr:RHS repeat protein [Deltaproteobacteria bacterium]